jgi:hypothetical protein
MGDQMVPTYQRISPIPRQDIEPIPAHALHGKRHFDHRTGLRTRPRICNNIPVRAGPEHHDTFLPGIHIQPTELLRFGQPPHLTRSGTIVAVHAAPIRCPVSDQRILIAIPIRVDNREFCAQGNAPQPDLPLALTYYIYVACCIWPRQYTPLTCTDPIASDTLQSVLLNKLLPGKGNFKDVRFTGLGEPKARTV